MNSKSIAAELGEKGYCICPGFLSPWSLRRLVQDFDVTHSSGQFRQAGIGRGSLRTHLEIRNDQTMWWDRMHSTPVQRSIWRRLDLLRLTFNRSLFMGLRDFEGHYAAYPPGGFYHRHLDCFSGDSGRVVSFILYLNREWRPEDGGRLRLFLKDTGRAENFLDIDPVAGTMVCFLSREFEHEVLQSHRPRHSLTGWFRR